MSHCQRARIPNEKERVSCMWIFASKVDSSAHLHADNFAYICIKRTEWCLKPTCSTVSLRSRAHPSIVYTYFVSLVRRLETGISLNLNSQHAANVCALVFIFVRVEVRCCCVALWLQIDWKGFWVDMLKAALSKSEILRSAVGLADILRMISL